MDGRRFPRTPPPPSAADSIARTPEEYVEVEWTPLVVGREEPSVFAEGINDFEAGWISEENSYYPIDVILAFPQLYDVHKLRIGGVDMLPQKVVVSAGRPRSEDPNPTHETARRADFRRKATIRFGARTAADEAEEEAEIKDVFIDAECQYIWLLLSAPHPHRDNRANQIRLTTLTIEGYVVDRAERRRKESRRGRREITTSTRRLLSAELQAERGELVDGRRSRGRTRTVDEDRRSAYSLVMTPPSAASRRRPRSIDAASVRSERALKPPGISIGDVDTLGDPLASIQMVRNAVAERRRRTQKKGHEVEATVCRRAIERLDAAATDMRRIRVKMEDARQKGDFEETQRLALALRDCRDTAFRVVHADILLDDRELLAAGYENFDEAGLRRRRRDY